MIMNIFLIGTGQMAIDYANVLKAQNHLFTVIGRGETSAARFKEVTGISPVTGGIEHYLKNNSFPDDAYIIIATGTQDLMQTMLSVLRAGAYKVLVEKPAALSIEELLENEENLKPYADNVFVAYNRRFYASVIEAHRMIEQDGGLKSMHFEFTEWSHKIEPLVKAPGVKENWFFANSTHVVDLAFYLTGEPVDWKAYSKSGDLKWHSKTNFAGAGITEKGVLFSYLSNWESAGRWGIELLTEKRRIYLKPLEGISIQRKGSVVVEEHLFDNILDTNFKPGIYKQVEAFFESNNSNLPKISCQIKSTKLIYKRMLQ